jgi:UDP-N-acetylenolpyruvoylglucosamine reductase
MADRIARMNEDLPHARGPVIRPGDEGFDGETRGYNQLITHRPALVVGVTGPADVMAAVRFAAERRMPVAVQATGHGPSVAADGAVFINTKRMTGVRVDPIANTVRVEAGVRSGQVVHEAAAHGLAPLNGSAPEVGAVSYVLGGGVPMLGRRFGYAADHVRQIDVVTADGQLHQASAEREPDLFWALRGSKGNHGVVVSLEMDLVPVARLYGGGMYFAEESSADVLHLYRAWAETVPEQMGSSVLLITLPNITDVPAPIRGRPVIHVRFAWSGLVEEGERWVRPFRDVGRPLIDTVREMPYREVGSIHHEPTIPVPFLSKHSMLRSLDTAAVDALLEVAGPAADPQYLVEIRHFGAALSRVPRVPNAIGRRDAAFSLYSGSVVTPGREDELRATQATLHERLRPWATGGACLNFLAGPDVTIDELRSAYLAEDFARLVALKIQYDPDNMFRINHNIPPA